MDGINKSGSREPRALGAINSSRVWMTSMSLGRELKALDAMNISGLWMT